MLCDVDRQAGATEASCGLLSVEPRVCGDTLRCSVVKRFGLGGWWVFLVAHLRLLLVIEDDRDTGPAHTRQTCPCYDAMCDALRCDTMLCAALRYAAM